jgi:hypothetical protein
MPPTIATASPPPGRPGGSSLGMGDPSRFFTLYRVPIFGTHPPKVKTVRDKDQADKDHPDGVFQKVMTCTREDLENLARNSNRRAETGRPATLQIGHTVLKDDLPEKERPMAVGLVNNFAVDDLDGQPHLFADLHYRREHHDQAVTFPRLSVERSAWADPRIHAVSAVALIRRKPDLDLPFVPYQAESPDQLVCYGADLPSPIARRSGAVTLQTWLRDTNLPDTPRNRRQFELVQQAIKANPDDHFEAFARLRSADRTAFLTWCGRKGLRASDPKAYGQFDAARAKGEA